ncbi:hypothetical protein ABW21_db0206723 [Orbilia brochopaga]|nr:hypothetical protein ABW21_db0206723 [Drechslerella brochopaga]
MPRNNGSSMVRFRASSNTAADRSGTASYIFTPQNCPPNKAPVVGGLYFLHLKRSPEWDPNVVGEPAVAMMSGSRDGTPRFRGFISLQDKHIFYDKIRAGHQIEVEIESRHWFDWGEIGAGSDCYSGKISWDDYGVVPGWSPIIDP